MVYKEHTTSCLKHRVAVFFDVASVRCRSFGHILAKTTRHLVAALDYLEKQMLQIAVRLLGLAAALGFSGLAVAADPVRYGSMAYHEALPGVLFLSGEIASGDSFALRRAMRDQEIKTVVTVSPGGNLYEGMQIASIINDNKLSTYLPDGSYCESACAIIFLGGDKRLVRGELGVHQFYSGAEDAAVAARKDVTAAVTQYTTAEIIGIMNQFDTPPFVYEKMFSTPDIYYFKGPEKEKLSRKSDDRAYLTEVSAIDVFIEANPITRMRPDKDNPAVASNTSPAATGLTMPRRQVPPPSSSGSRTDTMNNTDFFGSDLSAKGIRNVSLAECSDTCRDNPACAAFSYVSAKSWCWHKSAVENLSYAPGVISGIYRSDRVTPGLLDRPFFEISSNDLRGFDIFPKGLKNMTLEQCRSVCNGNASCVAFTWVIQKKWCFPKHDIGQLIKQNGVISGVHKSQL